MAASDHLSRFQFKYEPPEPGVRSLHQVLATDSGAADRYVGELRWTKNRITNLYVDPNYRRQGVAREMFRNAQAVAQRTPKVPQPKHSADRTDAGDAWARSVGGPLPRRSKFRSDAD